MYNHTKTPFINSAATDFHTQPQHRPVITTGTIPHAHYPNYNMYHIPMVSTALAHRYANTAVPAGEGGDLCTAETEAVLARRGSSERRGSSANRRGSGSAGDSSTGPPGKKQQRFEILRKLGSGTYGRVSLAMDHKAGEEVAIKVIRKSAIENTSDLIRIRREIRIMSALKHPNIIEIKEVFENDEKIILVMEYASGGELYDFVGKHGPLLEDEVRRLFRQIVSAVYYCHKHGVAHRDLKLENILLDKDMGAKIADFGLSNYFTDHSLLRTFCGSPLYASPEIINGTPYKGPEVDCWSLGVLLYTLAYSSMPFDGRDFNRMGRQIKRGAYYEPDPPSSASMLIRSMLRVCPERRATISDIAAHWWLNFDENASVIADLPENQVLDSTPLYIRQETMMIQSFGEENEMFAEFTHLSESTRKKIEEFRRRRREAEWYLIDCQVPLKKQSKKRSSSIINEQQKRQSSQAVMNSQKQSRENSGAEVVQRKNSKSSNAEIQKKIQKQEEPQTQIQKQDAGNQNPNPTKTIFTAAQIAAGEAGGLPDDELLDNLTDPLNRLKALENRLFLKDKPPPCPRVANLDDTPIQRDGGNLKREGGNSNLAHKSKQGKNTSKTMLKMSVDDLVQEKRELDKAVDNATAASLVSAVQEEGNRLVNHLLEEAMKGTVSNELVEKVKNSEAYKTETFVKEILESVLASQTKPPPTPIATPIPRPSRSKSKPSSLTKMPLSTSSLTKIPNTAPLPDVVSPGGEKIPGLTPDTFLPPDVVAAITEMVSPQKQLGPQTPIAPTPPVATPTVPLPLLKQSTIPQTPILTPTVAIPLMKQPPLPQTPPLPASPILAAATVTLPLMKLIYETVPEDAELQLKNEIENELIGEQPSTPASSEHEEDVCSTDFEDLGSDEEDEEAKAHKGDDSPLSGTGSFASTHSQLAELPEIRTVAPDQDESKLITETEDNPFLRGLSKRLSRGKYERSKFVFGRGVSIEESPRSSRGRLITEKSIKEQSIAEHENTLTGVQQNAGETIDGRKSPRGRRYSEGDKNYLTPLSVREDWMKRVDSDLSNQDTASIREEQVEDGKLSEEVMLNHNEVVKEETSVKKEKLSRETVKTTNDGMKKLEKTQSQNEKEQSKNDASKTEQLAKAINPEKVQECKTNDNQSPIKVENPDNAVIHESETKQLLSESQRRRFERAKLKKGLLAETIITPTPASAITTPPISVLKLDFEIDGLNDMNFQIHESKPVSKKDKASASVKQSVKKVKKVKAEIKNEKAQDEISINALELIITRDGLLDEPVLEPRVNTGQLIMDEGVVEPKEESTEDPEPIIERQLAADNGMAIADAETRQLDVSETKHHRPSRHSMSDFKNTSDISPEKINRRRASDPHSQKYEIQGDTVEKFSPRQNSTNIPIEQRRYSYRTVIDHSMNENQDSDRNQFKSSICTDHYSPTAVAGSRSSKYHVNQFGGVNVSEPLWLQYAREETHKHQQQSPYYHGYAGDYRSSYTHGHDDDHFGQRSHLPVTTAPYRGHGAYPSREISPPRSAMAPQSHRGYTAESADAAISPYSTAFGQEHAASNAARKYRKSKPPLFHQQSSDELLHDAIATSKKYAGSATAAVSGYAPAYSRRTTGSGDYYPSLYEDNMVYRRSHYDTAQPDAEDEQIGNAGKQGGNSKESSIGGNSNQFRVFQPKGLMKRRSRSLDKSQAKKGLLDSMDDEDVPSYTAYHESGSPSYNPSILDSKSTAKSILKKQSTLDSDSSNTTRYGDSDGRRPSNYAERLKRHFSNEKSPEPLDYGMSGSRKLDAGHYGVSGGDGGLADYANPATLYPTDGAETKARKRRTVLDSGRRKTTEIRYGVTETDYGDDYPYTIAKRPISPTEKTKGFFVGKSGAGAGSGTSAYHYYPSYTTSYQPTSTAAPSRDIGGITSNYIPTYRKPYQSSGYRTPAYAPSTARH